MQEIKSYSESVFEDIKHIDENGEEFWQARELQKVLEYTRWENFSLLIVKAKEACLNSNNNILDDFHQVVKIVKAGATSKKIIDYKLSRYACYLIVMNGDSRKEVIALGQTYFAIQTRKQELLEKEYNSLTEEEKRLVNRRKVKNSNLSLNKEASKRAIKQLESLNIVIYQEKHGCKKVLKAAAYTYVAGTLSSAIQILRLILIANSRRD